MSRMSEGAQKDSPKKSYTGGITTCAACRIRQPPHVVVSVPETVTTGPLIPLIGLTGVRDTRVIS